MNINENCDRLFCSAGNNLKSLYKPQMHTDNTDKEVSILIFLTILLDIHNVIK